MLLYHSEIFYFTEQSVQIFDQILLKTLFDITNIINKYCISLD